MLEALFITGVDDITVSGLTQWDRGQTVQITCPDLPELFQIHFANRKSKKAIVTAATASDGVTTVTLPDELLRQPYELIAWLYYNDGVNGETVKTIRFPVERRKKPEDYVVDLPAEQVTDAEKVITKLLGDYVEKELGAATLAQESATNASLSASAAADSAAQAKEHADSVNPEALMTIALSKADGHEFDEEEGLLYLTAGGVRIEGTGVKVATSGGGGEQNNAVLTLTNTSGFLYKSFSLGSACPLSFTWSSVENDLATGAGVLKISVGGTVKLTSQIEQGAHTIDVGPLMSAGTNTVKLNITDVYGNSRSINFSLTAVSLSIASPFDATVAYTGEITFPYVPTGSATKTVYFEMDGEPIGTATVTASGRQQTFTIPAQSHGAHIFECWFTAEIDGETVPSNKLRYAIPCFEEGNTTPIIATDFALATVEQYDTINIPYIVYNPASLTADIVLSDGSKTTELTVDRTPQIWSYRPNNEGELTLSIACGVYVTQIKMTVTPTTIDVEAETESLSLYLTSYGRTNTEANPDEWKYGAVSAELTGFNFTSDGWQLDEDGATVLRVSGDARVNIPVELFKTDFRTSGKTIEVKFATRDVLNYDAPIITCWSGDRGLQITAQKALLKSEQSEISTQYKEDEKVHLAFVVEKKSAHRLLMIYINGILSGVIQYPDDDDFSQNSPVGISIGSNECTTDVYCIRVYENDLTRYQVLDNWNAEMQLAADKADTWRHNDIFDDYGQIVIDKLPADLAYMVLKAPILPQYKGNKLPVDVAFTDPTGNGSDFTAEDAENDVQGTSSAGYERKNYRIEFINGFVINGEKYATYMLYKGSIPVAMFTLKADVASSEGANNVILVDLYNAACPYKTPPQLVDSRVRQGIYGKPIALFHDDGNGAVFIGKANFNFDKATPEVFGFAAGDQSWEIKNNTSNRALFKSADFSGTDWKNDFEARYPEDNTDVSDLAAMVAWVASTDRDAVTSEADKAARLEKFKNEVEDWFELDSSLFYYLFTELFLLADSRAKNAFPTKYSGGKWCWLPYDMDTAIGINNEGKLAFSYELEDTDLVNGAQVYTGQKSVFWNNLRDAFPDELMEMYQTLRSDGVLSYADTEKRFENHQSKWPEAIFNEDAYYKYLAPLFEKNNGSYLGMLQGSKAEQRKWWLYNRFRYIDSKYNAGDALTDFITLRGYAKGDITVTPYADIYATVKYGSYLVQERALRGGSYVLECPVDDLDDTEIYIYSASQIAELGDLSDLMVGYAEFAAGTKLKSLKLGDSADTYSNPNLTQLYAGNNVLLRTLDVRNCPNLGNTAVDVNATPSVNLSGCTNIEHIYFDNTAVTGVTLPNGGIIKTLHLPETITNLTIRNQTAITDFSMPSYGNISTLRIENVSTAVPVRDIFAALPNNSRVRLIGFDWTFDTAADILSFYDRLDLMRGLDENGGNLSKAQMSGTVRVENITGAQLSEMQSRYPDIKVVYAHITSTLTYCNWDGTVLATETVADGGDGKGMTATRASDAQYIYTHSGWSLTQGGAASANALKAVTADRTVYATYSTTLQKYTVTWVNGSTVVETDANVPYGTVPTYNGSTPVDPDGNIFDGWSPEISPVVGDVTYTAEFAWPYEPGTHWVQSNFTSKSVQSVTYADGLWVASVAYGGFYYSEDGKTWTASNVTNVDAYQVVNENGLWVAATAKGFYYSENGKTWTASNVTSGAFKTMICKNGIWISGSHGDKGLYYSEDGKTWTASNLASGYYGDVDYGNDIFVACNTGGGVYYSEDGKTWTANDAITEKTYLVTYANGIFILGGATAFYRSTDGRNWTKGSAKGRVHKSLIYANGLWVAGLYSKGMTYSSDGLTWYDTSQTIGYYHIEYVNGIWIAGSSAQPKGLYYSNDGITWTQSNMVDVNVQALAHDGDVVVAGSDAGVYYTRV